MSVYDRFAGKIALGDKVRITKRLLGTLYPNPSHDTKVEGLIGIVSRVRARTFVGGGERAPYYYVRMLEGPAVASVVLVEGDRHDDDMELVEKGDGTCVPGVHYPFTEDELRRQRYDALVEKVAAHDFRHQGYSNVATFLAWLYLNNESAFHAWLGFHRRKDGTVNAKKVEKQFCSLKLKIDAWAYQCPVDVPAEFANHKILGLIERTAVRWDEVAEQFKKED